MFVLLYDSDGHAVTGTGDANRKQVSMSVYRAGVFRVEVRNLGIRDSAFTLTTN